jgi:hypothetical protein
MAIDCALQTASWQPYTETFPGTSHNVRLLVLKTATLSSSANLGDVVLALEGFLFSNRNDHRWNSRLPCTGVNAFARESVFHDTPPEDMSQIETRLVPESDGRGILYVAFSGLFQRGNRYAGGGFLREGVYVIRRREDQVDVSLLQASIRTDTHPQGLPWEQPLVTVEYHSPGTEQRRVGFNVTMPAHVTPSGLRPATFSLNEQTEPDFFDGNERLHCSEMHYALIECAHPSNTR